MTYSAYKIHIAHQIALANSSDHDQINNFLKEDNLTHCHLDWLKPLEWLPENKAFFVDRIDNSIVGVLSCADEYPDYFWIRIFAAHRSVPHSQIMKTMLPYVIHDLQGRFARNLHSLAFEGWYETLLNDMGFRYHSSVVVLRHSGWPLPIIKTNVDIQIRQMDAKDIEQVKSIDNSSFDPIWRNSKKILSRAFSLSDFATVAILNNNLIGYQISTKSHNNAHLARLAVLPNYQNQQIGMTLAKNMIEHFHNHGVNKITVNTQSDNASSLWLYNKLGFIPTGESFPVLELNIPEKK